MATVTTKKLQCTFTAENGTDITYSLSDYKSALTDSEIQTGVEAMLSSGAIGSSAGSAYAVKSVKKIDTTTTDVTLL